MCNIFLKCVKYIIVTIYYLLFTIYYLLFTIYARGKPTRLAPMPSPAPPRACILMLGT